MSAPAGWFQDPQGPPGHLRWWDGRAWIEHRVEPPDAPVPAAWNPIGWAFRHPVSALLLAVVGALVIAGIVDSAGEDLGMADGRPSATGAADPPRVAADPDDEPVIVHDRGRRESQPAPRPRPPRPYLVTRIVDGDTLELGNGEIVRLVGIDTPEAGECGHERAADTLARQVLGKQVRLGESDEGRDRYDRLLRYVDIGNQDAGLRLIKNGLAVARYDSRDSYGFHPREPRYVAADKGTRPFTCAPKPQPFVQQPPAGGGCAPGYTPCVPAYPPDVDCPDVDGPIAVSGADPHRLDADHDGIACE